jgi:hypothetical protein
MGQIVYRNIKDIHLLENNVMYDFVTDITNNFNITNFGEEDKKKDEAEVIEQRAEKRQIKNEQRTLKKVTSLNDLCGTPAEGEQWRIITQHQYNAFTLILHLLKETKIKEMYLAIYRINQPTVKSITQMIEDGRIGFAYFVISDFFNHTRRPEKWADQLRDFCIQHPDACEHRYVNNHAKVCCVRTEDDRYFVFEGSGNMSDNGRVEQYIYEQSKQMYDFHKKWMIEIKDDDKN